MKISTYSAASAVLALCLLLSASADAFLPSNKNHPQGAVGSTQLGLFGFLKDGKKALVRSLAGDFDEAAIQKRLEGLIANNKVLML